MSRQLALAGIGGMVVSAAVGLWLLFDGRLVPAGTFFILFSFSLYLWETNR